MARSRDDYDTTWKEAISRHFRSFLEFFFPHIAEEVDWNIEPLMLDKELHSVAKRKRDRREADLLVRITRLSGVEEWVFIHVEVQSQPDPAFPLRMYTYQYRLFDKFERDIVSLAILGDEDQGWRPDRYERSLWGCSNVMTFPTCKLLDLPEEIQRPRNPFSWLVSAHRQAQRSRNKPGQRLTAKLGLVRALYSCGLTREEVVAFFDLVDRVLALPQEMEYAFTEDLIRLEEEVDMPYMNSVERVGHRKGLEQGRAEGREEGREEGQRVVRREVAGRLLESGLSLEKVAQALAVTPSELQSLLST